MTVEFDVDMYEYLIENYFHVYLGRGYNIKQMYEMYTYTYDYDVYDEISVPTFYNLFSKHKKYCKDILCKNYSNDDSKYWAVVKRICGIGRNGIPKSLTNKRIEMKTIKQEVDDLKSRRSPTL